MSSRKAALLLLLVASASSLGCSHRPGPRSAYNTFYQKRLGELRLPTHEEIASAKDLPSQPFDQPASKVWEACLGLAAQSRGILAAANDPAGGHRLLLIAGETLWYSRIQAPQQTFVDRWLAVSVRPVSESSATVNVAFVSPKTARVAPYSADSLSLGFQGDKNISISLRSAGTFMLALKATFMEDEHLERFKGASRSTPRGVPRAIEAKIIERGKSVADQRGNYDSANIRREWFVLNMPRLQGQIADVIHDLARAANQPSEEIHIFIVASSEPDFHIEPNGDLFMTTDYLDRMMNVDELAGALSHELAHLYINHGSARTGAFRRAGASRNMITMTFMLGGAVLHFLSTRPDSVAPEDTGFLAVQDVLAAAAVQLGSYYLAGQVGTGIGTGVGSFAVHRFTRKQELEADEYGAELLWAAGYDYKGLLHLLQREGTSMLVQTEER